MNWNSHLSLDLNGTPEVGRILPGGARVVAMFNNPDIQSYQEMVFSAHPGRETGLVLGEDLMAMLGIVQMHYPHHRIDVWVHREPFQAGAAESFSAHELGTHADGYDFFVLSTYAPTRFFSEDKLTSAQAPRGALVFVPGKTLHSSPIPTTDGERVRIKLIPRLPYGEVDDQIFQNFIDESSMFGNSS